MTQSWLTRRTALLFFLFLAPCLAAAAEPGDVNLALNRAAYQSSAINYDNVAHLATDGSDQTFWQSGPEDRPWIYVDLGGRRKISSVELEWGSLTPAGCSIQVSTEDASPTRWTDVAHLATRGERKSRQDFPRIDARFVRMFVDAGGASGGCQVVEFAVLGQPLPAPPPTGLALPTPDREGRMPLDGAGWKLQNSLFLHAAEEAIAAPSFSADSWLPAKVPGTALGTYLAAGAVPDPDYGDQQRLVSESFFQNDFWYRKEFIPPRSAPRRHFFLNFAGINWKARSTSMVRRWAISTALSSAAAST